MSSIARKNQIDAPVEITGCIVCDDVRQEVSGAVTLVGAWLQDIPTVVYPLKFRCKLAIGLIHKKLLPDLLLKIIVLVNGEKVFSGAVQLENADIVEAKGLIITPTIRIDVKENSTIEIKANVEDNEDSTDSENWDIIRSISIYKAKTEINISEDGNGLLMSRSNSVEDDVVSEEKSSLKKQRPPKLPRRSKDKR